MTANVPANSWPNPVPPSAPARTPVRQPSFSRTLSQLSWNPQTRVNEDAFEENSRPNKRRKVDVPTSAIPAGSPTVVKENGIETRWSRATGPMPYTWRQEGNPQVNEDLQALEPPPLPIRPAGASGLSTVPKVEEQLCRRVRLDVAVPTVPDSMSCPDDAPHFMQGKTAGYFPWSGKHPEDVLSETSVKQGYFDRPPNPPEKELNSAKTPLYNALKHRAGLESLTTLFSLVLEQKDKHCAISSASSFKPPPRVTLTEAKRKSWIADLANNDVPLRKLSRTIPQGIRGQILLEQCLTNVIPLSRAVWFAKCVGANEIRTLKRTGTNPAVANQAESKWLKDWTITIEQFVETVVMQCGQPSWKISIQYALRMATRFYTENLLDRDHYLDWVIRLFSSSKLDHAPFWFMMIHIHREDLTRFRKRGRRLAAALLERLDGTDTTQGDKLQPFSLKLSEDVRTIAITRPMCFLDPDRWSQHETTLRKCLRPDILAEDTMFARLRNINIKSMGATKHAYCAAPTLREKIFEILDSANPPFDLTNVLTSINSCCPDKSVVTSIVLEWATTCFRFGAERTYLTTRLCKKWVSQGHDIDSAIFHFVTELSTKQSIARQAVRKLMAELSRAQIFSLSRYLQWLTVRGLPGVNTYGVLEETSVPESDRVIKAQPNGSAVGLLTELSLSNCDDHIANLRRSMLLRAGYNVVAEEETFDTIKTLLVDKVKAMSGSAEGGLGNVDSSFLPLNKLGWTLKTRIAHLLRGQAIFLTKSNSVHGLPNSSNYTAATLFHLIRTVLEEMDEMAVLADVIGIMATLPQEGLLAALTDTVHCHMRTFWALGAFEPLYRRLCHAYASLRRIKSVVTQFTISLLDLCDHAPIKLLTSKVLQQDLVQGDRGRVLAACSPFSEGVAESLQQAGTTFIEDFEAILQSEPNMNEQTMASLVPVLTGRIEKEQALDMKISLCQLLARLRVCRKCQANNLIARWLNKLLVSRTLTVLAFDLRALIGTRCLGFPELVASYRTIPEQALGPYKLGEVIQLLLEHERQTTYPQAQLQYVVELQWSRYARTSSLEVLQLFDASHPSLLDKVQDQLLPGILDVGPSEVSKIVSAGWLSAKLNVLLNSQTSSGVPHVEPAKVIRMANPLSFSLCIVLLRIQSHSGAESRMNDMQELLAKGILQPDQDSQGSSTSYLPYLLEATSSKVANKLFVDSQMTVLDSFPTTLHGKALAQPLVVAKPAPLTSQALSQSFSLAQTSTAEMNINVLSQLMDKLNTMYKLYIAVTSTLNPAQVQPGGIAPTGNGPTSAPTSAPVSSPIMPSPAPVASSQAIFTHETEAREFLGVSLDYLDVLLQMTCLQRAGLTRDYSKDNPVSAKQAQQFLMKLVLITTFLATQLTSLIAYIDGVEGQSKARSLVDFAFSVAATLIDELSDEIRAPSVKILKDRMKDERVKWLFGSINIFGSLQAQELGQGLVLLRDGKGPIGEFKPKLWEILESGSGKESETCIGLGLFGARRN